MLLLFGRPGASEIRKSRRLPGAQRPVIAKDLHGKSRGERVPREGGAEAPRRWAGQGCQQGNGEKACAWSKDREAEAEGSPGRRGNSRAGGEAQDGGDQGGEGGQGAAGQNRNGQGTGQGGDGQGSAGQGGNSPGGDQGARQENSL